MPRHHLSSPTCAHKTLVTRGARLATTPSKQSNLCTQDVGYTRCTHALPRHHPSSPTCAHKTLVTRGARLATTPSKQSNLCTQDVGYTKWTPCQDTIQAVQLVHTRRWLHEVNALPRHHSSSPNCAHKTMVTRGAHLATTPSKQSSLCIQDAEEIEQ